MRHPSLAFLSLLFPSLQCAISAQPLHWPALSWAHRHSKRSNSILTEREQLRRGKLHTATPKEGGVASGACQPPTHSTHSLTNCTDLDSLLALSRGVLSFVMCRPDSVGWAWETGSVSVLASPSDSLLFLPCSENEWRRGSRVYEQREGTEWPHSLTNAQEKRKKQMKEATQNKRHAPSLCFNKRRCEFGTCSE